MRLEDQRLRRVRRGRRLVLAPISEPSRPSEQRPNSPRFMRRSASMAWLMPCSPKPRSTRDSRQARRRDRLLAAWLTADDNGKGASMSEARFQPVADLLDPWREDVLSGKPPTLYPIGSGELVRIEIGPKLVTLIGGAPGQGKTALTMQMLIDALMLTPSLKALVCNCEMSPSTLLDRQLARLAGIDLALIRHRRLTAEHSDAIRRGTDALESLADRLAFGSPALRPGERG